MKAGDKVIFPGGGTGKTIIEYVICEIKTEPGLGFVPTEYAYLRKAKGTKILMRVPTSKLQISNMK